MAYQHPSRTVANPVGKESLTKRQKEIYDFLKDKIMNRGYGPTVREIGAEFGIRSPNGVMCHLNALEKKGLIKRESHKSRAIQLTEEPQKRMQLPLDGKITGKNPLGSVEVSHVDFSGIFDTENHFALQVDGDGLKGMAPNNSFIIFRRQDKARNRDVVLLTNGDGETARVGELLENGRKFKPIGAKNPTNVGDHKVKILGVKVAVIQLG